MIEQLKTLLRSHGHLFPGRGLVPGVIALTLALLCLLAVLAFHFPQYLTTPQLRAAYDVEVLRAILLAALIVAGGLSVTNLLLNRNRWLASVTFALVLICVLLGDHRIAVDPNFPEDAPSIGLDWFILDLLGSSLIFIFIEKLFPLRREQPVFRAEWQVDLQHFAMNHLLVGFLTLLANTVVHRFFGPFKSSAVQSVVAQLPFAVGVLFMLLTVDLVQYWIHRAYHEVPLLWRLHAVHHSVKSMDWLAGSRQHLLEVLMTRMAVLAPIYVLGFSQEVINAYVIIVGFQAVFNHANVNVRLGWLRNVIVTPNFHHWHHSQDRQAIDRNYAAHFAFFDLLFKTAVKSTEAWPREYGVVGDYVPQGYVKQLKFPWTWKG